MREQTINVLANALLNNIGNRLTNELANGIATAVNQAMLEMEQMAAAAPPIDAGDAP